MPLHRLHLWCRSIVPQKFVVLVVGTCNASCPHGIIHRIEKSVPTRGHAKRRYNHLHNKLELWNLPYSRVVYYDIDTVVKPPVTRCAAQCRCQFCAVRSSRNMATKVKNVLQRRIPGVESKSDRISPTS